MFFIKKSSTLAFGSLFFLNLAYSAPIQTAILGQVEGTVFVNNVRVYRPVELKPNSVIKTGRDSRAILLLGGTSVVHVGEDSVMKLSDIQFSQNITLDLVQGRTRALVKTPKTPESIQLAAEKPKVFRIRTKAATMGVRGTQILVEQAADLSQPTTFTTLEGRAEVQFTAAAAPIALVENQSVAAPPPSTRTAAEGSAQPSRPSNPVIRELPASEVKQMVQSVAPAPPPPQRLQDLSKIESDRGEGKGLGGGLDRPPLQIPGVPSANNGVQRPLLDPVINSPVNRVRVEIQIGGSTNQ